jgi:hypothetical protein
MLTFSQMDTVVEQAKELEALAFVLYNSLISATNGDYHAQTAGLLFYRLRDLHTKLDRLLEKTRPDRGNGQGAKGNC